MPKPKPFARIAITLPEKDLASADRLALRHDRSRSWIVAEAIRRYAADDSTAPEVPAATTFEVEGVAVPTASIEDLIESKRTGRLQDAADIEVLEEIRRLLARRRSVPGSKRDH